MVGVAGADRDLAPTVADDTYWSTAQDARRKEGSTEEGGNGADERGYWLMR